MPLPASLHCPHCGAIWMWTLMRPVPVKKATLSLVANVGPNASHSNHEAESGEAE